MANDLVQNLMGKDFGKMILNIYILVQLLATYLNRDNTM